MAMQRKRVTQAFMFKRLGRVVQRGEVLSVTNEEAKKLESYFEAPNRRPTETRAVRHATPHGHRRTSQSFYLRRLGRIVQRGEVIPVSTDEEKSHARYFEPRGDAPAPPPEEEAETFSSVEDALARITEGVTSGDDAAALEGAIRAVAVGRKADIMKARALLGDDVDEGDNKPVHKAALLAHVGG